MLAKQVETWEGYNNRAKAFIDFVVVDDGSPEPAVVPEWVRLYRIHEDIPWNRSGARNLGVHVAETDWILHVDTDHVLPTGCADALLDFDFDPKCWYRFPRFRVGKADETRRKDKLDDDCEFGRVKEHIDSYICTKDLYWKAGGYNEAYSGCLGGGSPFLAELAKVGECKILPEEVALHVYTRHVVPDSSIFTLDRDTSEYKRLRAEFTREGCVKGSNPLRFDWSQVQ